MKKQISIKKLKIQQLVLAHSANRTSRVTRVHGDALMWLVLVCILFPRYSGSLVRHVSRVLGVYSKWEKVLIHPLVIGLRYASPKIIMRLVIIGCFKQKTCFQYLLFWVALGCPIYSTKLLSSKR